MFLLFWITTHSLNRPPVHSQTLLHFTTGLPFTPKYFSILQQASHLLPDTAPFYNRPPIHSQTLLHFTTGLPFIPRHCSILQQASHSLPNIAPFYSRPPTHSPIFLHFTSGTVNPNSSLDCEVVWHPAFMAPEDGAFQLHVSGGTQLQLKCRAEVSVRNHVLVPQLKIGEVLGCLL